VYLQIDCWNPIHIACYEGEEEIIKLIISLGGKFVNQTSKYLKWTPLHVACGKGNLAVYRILENRGAGCGAVDVRNRSVLHMACLGGNLEIVEDLITNKSQSILFPDNDGRMALHWACVGKHFEIIRYLQDLGMNVKEPDKVGSSIS
jgi:ankyrin repeat protein